MSIHQTVRLDEEEIFDAIQKHLRDKSGIEIPDETELRFPTPTEADSGEKYIEMIY